MKLFKVEFRTDSHDVIIGNEPYDDIWFCATDEPYIEAESAEAAIEMAIDWQHDTIMYDYSDEFEIIERNSNSLTVKYIRTGRLQRDVFRAYEKED